MRCHECGTPMYYLSNGVAVCDPCSRPSRRAVTLAAVCDHTCLKPAGHDGPHFHGYRLRPDGEMARVADAINEQLAMETELAEAYSGAWFDVVSRKLAHAALTALALAPDIPDQRSS